jgi:type IV secretion system protein VirB6
MASAFSALRDSAIKPFELFANTTSVVLTEAVIPLVLAGLTINIAWQGINILRGSGGKSPILDLFVENFRTVFVLLCALGVGNGYQNIISYALELKTALMQTGTGDAASTSTIFDNLLATLMALDQAGYELAVEKISFIPVNITGIAIILIAGTAELVIFLFLCVTFCEVVVAEAAIYLVTAVGPLFVAAAAFKATTSYFSGWLSGLLRYVFEIAVLLALAGMSVQLVDGYLGRFSADVSAGDLSAIKAGTAQLVLAGILLIYLVTKVHSIVGSMFGSGSISGIGPAMAAAIGGMASKGMDLMKGSSPESQANLIGKSVADNLAKSTQSNDTPGAAGTGMVTGGPNGLGSSSKGITEFPPSSKTV